MKMQRLGCAMVGWIVLAAGVSARADVVLDPKTYTSSNGEYELLVDPGEMDGSGSGVHKLRRRGVEIWAKDLPYTLCDVVLTDQGIAAGYAYTHGYDGRGRDSAIVIVILNTDGTERLAERRPREHSGLLSTPPSPYAPLIDQIFVDEEHDRFVVQTEVYGRSETAEWWRYRLSTGERLGDLTPDQPPRKEMRFHRAINTLAVPHTSFTLHHWYIYDGHARFSLCDENGHAIWSLEIQGEYQGLGHSFRWNNLKSQGISQIETRETGFDILSYKENQRISFTIARNPEQPDEWTVQESERSPVQIPSPVDATRADLPEYPEIPLTLAGEIELQTASDPNQPIRNVVHFAINKNGQIGAVVRRNEAFHIVVADGDGGIIMNQPCALDEGMHLGAFGVTGEGKWVLVASSWDEGVAPRAWFINVPDGARQPIEGLDIGRTEAIAPRLGGGFFIHARIQVPYSLQDDVQCVDEDGKRLWSMRTQGYGQGMMIQDIASTGGGGLAVLTAVQSTIELFDGEGKHLKSLTIAEAIGTKPNYVAGLKEDEDGGLILHDFRGSPPIHRIGADGTLRGSLSPAFEDGRTFRLVGDVQCGPDGRLWTSDGNGVLRLDEKGIVDRIVGTRPTDNSLDEIADLKIGADGRIYALNARTAAVHVFDQQGAFVRLITPEPTDFPTAESAGSIALAAGGYVYIRRESDGRTVYLEFDESGERVGFQQLDFDSISEEWLFRPGTLERWVLGYQKVGLFDIRGQVAKVIRRRPDNKWLQIVDDAAVAPDGSLAVLTRPDGFGFGPIAGTHLCLYAATGEGVQTVPAPASLLNEMAWTGRFAAISVPGRLYIYDASTKQWRQSNLPEDQWWRVVTSPDGSELWLWANGLARVQRWRIPSEDQ